MKGKTAVVSGTQEEYLEYLTRTKTQPHRAVRITSVEQCAQISQPFYAVAYVGTCMRLPDYSEIRDAIRRNLHTQDREGIW